jgi:hypothetical protein
MRTSFNINPNFLRRGGSFKSPIALVIIGVVVIGFSVYSYITTNDFIKNAKETTGVVEDVYVKKVNFSVGNNNSNRSNSPEYCPVVAFETESGDSITFKSSSGSTNFDTYKVGKTVEVLYNPENPTKARIKSRSNNQRSPLLVGGAGLLFTVFGFIAFRKKRKKS